MDLFLHTHAFDFFVLLLKSCDKNILNTKPKCHFLTGNESDVACNHFRAVDFYTASIGECDFTGFACDNYDAFVKGQCFPCAGAGSEGGVECRSPGWDLKSDKASSQPLYFLTRPGPPFCGKSSAPKCRVNKYSASLFNSGKHCLV